MKRTLLSLLALIFVVAYSNVEATDPATAASNDIEVNFGMVIKNQNGEPVGFRQTRRIPHNEHEPSVLYGVVITSQDQTPLTLGVVHVLPKVLGKEQTKIMGKPMRIVGRGAIFLQADKGDALGKYDVEVYINHRLYRTISYELVSDQVDSATSFEAD